MSIGFSIAIRAVPFFDLLDKEEESLAAQVIEARGGAAANVAMDTSRRRLAQGIDAFVRSLPTGVRSDVNTSRWAAYALAGLVDERMLHHPAGGLDRWRERLLEFELYGSALAGQEIVDRARAAAFGTMTATGFADDRGGDSSLLAPLYLGLFRSGFEGSLRGDLAGLASLVTSLEETIGAGRQVPDVITADRRPTRVGLSATSMAVIGVAAWLVGGAGFWMMLSQDALEEARRIEERVLANLPIATGPAPLERSIGPSGLPPLERPADEDE